MNSILNGKTTGHTPGPWNIAHDFDATGLIESGFGNVATVAGFGNPDDETRPNAALLAAAPDLLAACKGLVERAELERIEHGDNADYRWWLPGNAHVWRQMALAVEKATGEWPG